MNHQKEKVRVRNGKPAKLFNASMAKDYAAGPTDEVDANGQQLGAQAFSDLTDKQNDEVCRDFFPRACAVVVRAS